MKKLGILAGLVVAVMGSGIALSACGSSSSSGKEGGVLQGAYTSFPDYMDPQISYTAEGWTTMQNVYIPLLTYKHADGRRGRQGDPGPRRGSAEDHQRRQDLHADPAQGPQVLGRQRRSRPSDFQYAVERMFVTNSGGAPFYTDIVGAAQFQKTRKPATSPGSRPTTRPGEIIINLVQPRGTFNERAGADVRRAGAAEHPGQGPDARTRRPSTGPYTITKSSPGRGWTYERNPQWEKNNAKIMPDLPSGHVDKIVIDGDPQPVEPGQRRRVGQHELDLRSAPVGPLRGGEVQVRGHPVPHRDRRSAPTTSG